MKRILIIALGLFKTLFVHGQELPSTELQKTIDKVLSLKSLSYDCSSLQKNPYSSDDTSFISIKSTLEFNGKGILIKTLDKMDINRGQAKFESRFRNDTLFQIDLKDSSYSFYPKPLQSSISAGLMSVIALIKNNIEKDPEKIFQRKDTIIHGNVCQNFFIKSYDSIVNRQHNFTYDYIAIDIASHLPVTFKEVGQGIAEKDGHIIGRLVFFNEDHFYNFKVDKLIDPALFDFDLDDFSLPNKKMMSEGDVMPTLKLKSLQNKEVSPIKFKNTLLLIEFGATDCGANPLANPMLNRLYKKYTSAKFSIVTIYTEEPADKVKKYVKANNLEFPVYIGSKQLKKAFRAVGTPNFYLVNKNGRVIKSIEGYSDDLQKELTAEIDLAFKNN
jgi:thiol-disulfide isomerase/thioredoxin